MKLAAIYNVWDGHELLEDSIKSIREHVDTVIVVWQHTSNYGEYDNEVENVVFSLTEKGLIDKPIFYRPPFMPPHKCETEKRNLGIEEAKRLGCSHYLLMDTDEFYGEDFPALKRKVENGGYDATALHIYVYYKSPYLRFKRPDKTIVPFIHKLYPNSVTGKQVSYGRGLITDRTRTAGPVKRFALLQGYMHHLSWIRADINKKIMNSTAKKNINRADIREDYEKAEAGYYVKSIFKDTLIESDFFEGKLSPELLQKLE